MTTTQHLQRPFGRLGYAVDGPVDGPLVLLVPGMGDLRRTWDAVARDLVAHGCHVAALDLRGHGDSDPDRDPAGHGVAPIADDVLALARHLGATPDRPVVLVGSSVGAGGVVRAAADAPDLVAGVVTLAYAANDGTPSRGVRLQVRVLLNRPWGPRAWAWFYRSLVKAPVDVAAHTAALRADLARPGHLAQLRTLALRLVEGREDTRLAAVHAPVVAILGDADPESKDHAAELEHMVATAPDVTPVLLPGVGHYPQHEATAVVVERIAALVDRVLPAATPRPAGPRA